MLYGEKTVQVNYRVPESKKEEINGKIELILKSYQNPTKIEIEVLDVFRSKEHTLKEKKSNPTDIKLEDNYGPQIVEIDKINSDSNKKLNNIPAVDLKNLTKKANIEEEYDFVYVKSIPDQEDQIPVDKKGLAFYSKYDLGVFYVKWEGKYMKFEIKSEFDRFAKEYLTLI